MTDRERLIELIDEALENGCRHKFWCSDCSYFEEEHCSIAVIADFLIANGVTVQKSQPCKPGDTVYFILCRTDGNHEIRKGWAFAVEYCVCYKPLITIRYDDKTLDSTKHYLGNKAFMTREEAEDALSRMTAKPGPPKE